MYVPNLRICLLFSIIFGSNKKYDLLLHMSYGILSVYFYLSTELFDTSSSVYIK